MSDKSKAATASAAFTKWVNGLSDDDHRVIIIVSHVPMHARRNDNAGGATWLNVINAAANKKDIIFLWGHNHTGSSDADKSVQYVTPDGYVSPQGGSSTQIKFTYALAGYTNKSNADWNGTSVTITNNEIKVDHYVSTNVDSSSTAPSSSHYDTTSTITRVDPVTDSTDISELTVTVPSNSINATIPQGGGSVDVGTLSPTIKLGSADVTDDANITYSSSDINVATVNNSGLVTGLAAGTATITITATYTPDGDGESYTATQDVTVTISEYSEYSEYIVDFESNGGSSVDSQTVTAGGKATEPTAPTKDGFTFGGWYSNEDLTDEYDFDTPVTEDITLYAKWTESSTTEKEVYVLTTSVTSGNEYLIVSSGTAGAAHAIANNASNTSTGSNIDPSDIDVTATIGTTSGGDEITYIETADSYAVWTAGKSSSSYTFKNGSYYLYHDGGKPYVNTTTSKNTWKLGTNQLYYSGGSGSNKTYYFLQYGTDGWELYNNSTSSTNTTSYVYFYEKQTVEVVDTHEHTWGEPTYIWADDNRTVTATRICTNDASHEESETVSASYAVTTPASCGTAGVGTYISEAFKNAAFEVQTKTVAIPATGHDYAAPVYEWSADNKTVTVDTTYTIIKEATPDKDGTGRYAATFENGMFETQTKDVTIPAIGHNYVFVDFTWTKTDDGYTAKANYRCTTEEGHTPSLEASVTSEIKTAASCLADGSIEYTAAVSATVSLDEQAHSESRTETIPATGHDWNDPTYKWATDKSKVTATRTCKHDASHVETETVDTTSVTTAATCETAGKTVYTSKAFKNEAFTTQTTEVTIPALGHALTAHPAVAVTCENPGNSAYWSCSRCGKFFSNAQGTTEIAENSWVIDATGHDWDTENITWTWAKDNSTATATFKCKRDENHTQIVNAAVTSTTSAATCEEAGQTDYTAEATFNNVKYGDNKKVEIPALGHDWNDPTYEWSADNKKVTATRTCKNDPSHVETETVVTSYEITKPATETTAGEGIWTSEEFGNEAFGVQTKKVEIPATGYEVTYKWADDLSSVTATAVPYDTSVQTITETADTTSEVTKPATCEAKGETTYTATFRNGVFASQSKTIANIDATGHDWSEVTYTWADDYSSVTAARVCKNDPAHVETETAQATYEETKPATETTAGERTWSAEFKNAAFEAQTKKVEIPPTGTPEPTPAPGSNPNQGGAGGPVGPGASAASAERAITGMTSDTDLPGAAFGKLMLRSPKQGKNSIKLSWSGVSGASKYVIYGNKCGKGNKPVKIAEVRGTTITFSSLAKGTYYKYVAVALNGNNNVVSTSKLIHVATKGGKVGNHKSVKVAKAITKKAKKLKAGKSLKLKAKAVPQSKKLKVKKHVAVRYESTNPSIATVSSKGKIKAKSKGTCYVYAYAQNGVFKRIKIVVK